MGLSIFSNRDLDAESTAIKVPRKCCITALMAYEKIMKLFEARSVDKPALSGKEWIVFYLFLQRLMDKAETTLPMPQKEERAQKRQR